MKNLRWGCVRTATPPRGERAAGRALGGVHGEVDLVVQVVEAPSEHELFGQALPEALIVLIFPRRVARPGPASRARVTPRRAMPRCPHHGPRGSRLPPTERAWTAPVQNIQPLRDLAHYLILQRHHLEEVVAPHGQLPRHRHPRVHRAKLVRHGVRLLERGEGGASSPVTLEHGASNECGPGPLARSARAPQTARRRRRRCIVRRAWVRGRRQHAAGSRTRARTLETMRTLLRSSCRMIM